MSAAPLSDRSLRGDDADPLDTARDGWAAPVDEHGEELIMHLERDQLVAETFRPVAPARLGRRALLGLWALRVFAVLVSAMVLYTFLARLH
jgi:hypothetical protein